MVGATSGRRRFVTRSGYLGLGPDLTRAGDQVVIFLGGSTPSMLRGSAHSEAYELLGDCYLHGCMHGDFLDSARVDEWPTSVLE